MAIKDSDRLDGIVDPAASTLHKLFTTPGDDLSDKDITAARTAASVLSTWAKLKMTERAQEAMTFNMARELANNPEQLEAYIKASMPDVPLVKVLQAKKLPELKDKT